MLRLELIDRRSRGRPQRSLVDIELEDVNLELDGGRASQRKKKKMSR